MWSSIASIILLLLLSNIGFGNAVELNHTLHQKGFKNPLQDFSFHVEPSYRNNVKRSIRGATKHEKTKLRRILNVPTAFWLEDKQKVRMTMEGKGIRTAEHVLKDASQMSRIPLVTFIVYNLPNRDCSAASSAGEICCRYNDDGTCNFLDTSNKCEDGIAEYKSQYIDLLAMAVGRYCNAVPMAFIIEPDSLPNLVTNLDNPKCSNPATQASYRSGTKYAVKKLKSTCSKTTIYVDAAHGGWLGWEDNTKGFLTEIKKLRITSLIRGFALNVANYQEMGTLCPEVGTCLPSSPTNGHKCCRKDSCNLSSQYNPGFTLLNYAASFRKIAAVVIPSFDVHFLLDTGRNGVPDARKSSCSNWCNIRGAGLGVLPTTKTADPSMIDAYMWLKVPGESDGCAEILPGGRKCPRFDESCGSPDSLGSKIGEPRAPRAGNWFDFQVRMLARNS